MTAQRKMPVYRLRLSRTMPAPSPLVSVFADNGRCAGFVIARGKLGHEAFDFTGAKSLGFHETQAAAAKAIRKRAREAS